MQLWQRDLNFFPVQAAAQPLSEVEALVDAGNFDIALMPVTSTQNSVEAYLGCLLYPSWATMAPPSGPNTSRSRSKHRVYRVGMG